MNSIQVVIEELSAAGFLRQTNQEQAQSVFQPYYEAALDAESAKRFAREDEDHQAKVVADAQELAESDLDMGQIEDRFIQAEIIEAAAELSDKDEALYERADARLVAACTEAAQALAAAGLAKQNDLEAVTRLIARLWNPD